LLGRHSLSLEPLHQPKVIPILKGACLSWAPVAHDCDPDYLGGRDQEVRGSKPTRQIVCETLPWKKPWQKRTSGVTQDVDPEFKP
jgi:hypothetical protein